MRPRIWPRYFPALLAQGKPLYGTLLGGYLQDTGTPDAYRQANWDLLAGRAGFTLTIRNLWIAPTAQIGRDVSFVGRNIIGEALDRRRGSHSPTAFSGRGAGRARRQVRDTIIGQVLSPVTPHQELRTFMIITQTPLRISFAGGGTDFKATTRRTAARSSRRRLTSISTSSSKSDLTAKSASATPAPRWWTSVDQIEHELVRECMRLTGITGGVEIATMADIPSEGSGLGSSSTVTVGLLHAMYAYQGILVTAETLAEQACRIEIDILGKPIGKQDQYIAAYGSLRRFEFHADGTVTAHSVDLTEEKRRRFGESLMLFYTGITRQADAILSEQKANIEDKRASLDRIKGQVAEVEAA